MKSYIDKYGVQLQLLFKILFLIHLLFSLNIILVGTPIAKLVMVVSVFLGFVLLLTRLTQWRQIIFSFEGAVLILFLISYIVSVVINMRYGINSGLKYFIWFCLLIGGVFWVDRNIEHRLIKREMLTLSVVLLIIVTITNIVSLALLISKYNTIYAGADGNYYVMGFASWGRLYGVYVDPNYGAVISCAAILAAVFCLLYAKRLIWKIIFALSVIPNIFYCAFSASRTGKIAMMIGSAIIVFVYLLKKCKKIYWLKSVAAAVCASVVSIAVLNGVQAGYNKIQLYISESKQNIPNQPVNNTTPNNSDKTDKPSENTESNVTIIDRTEELNGDISNRRFDIWSSGLKVFMKNPLFGIGWNNTIAYVRENMPDSYLLGEINDLAYFDIFHNSFIDVFVFQGLFGGILMIILIIYTLILLIKKIVHRKYEPRMFAWSVAGIMLCVFSGCVLSVLVYFNNAISYLFWLFLGYIMYFCKSKENAS